jgi:hypothetical protein
MLITGDDVLRFCETCEYKNDLIGPDEICARQALESMHSFLGRLGNREVISLPPQRTDELEAYHDTRLTLAAVRCIGSVSQGGEPISGKIPF